MSKVTQEYLLGFASLLLVIALALSLMTGLMQQDWATQSSLPSSDFIVAGPFKVAVTIRPEKPQVGKNHIVIQVRDQHDQPVIGANVRAVGEMPAMGAMPAMYAQADIKETTAGVYQGEFELSMAGAWPLAVDIATDDEHHVDLSFAMATTQKGLRLSTSTPVGDVAYHTCSMHPSVKSATPGTCPICSMDLISVTHDELNSGSIIVEEGRRQTIGIKTGKVVSENFAVPVRLQGEVTVDPRQLSDISLRFDGWIGDLRADFVGKSVKQSDMLFTVYSPKLLTLQEEYLATFKQGKNNWALLKATRKRLKLWGLSATQISWLEKQGQATDYLPIFAPSSFSGKGVVIEKNIVSGSAFKKGQRLLRLADLSSVWIEAFAYEQDLALIEQGMMAKVQLSNFPGQDFNAEVMHIDPFLGAGTRTARVQLVLDNKQGQFKPGLFAKVTLQAELGEQLLIPHEAILVSGEKRIVFMDLGEGRLKPKEIKTGYSDGVNVVVRDGLSAGDIIVTSGNFLVASESKLKSGLDQW